jgi:RHS repeat-associated protein
VERSSGGAVVQETSFTYDVFDRRIGKTVDLDGAGPLAAQTIRFVHDGEHAWADFDGSGNLVARYLFGDQTDEILARFRPGQGIAWYLTDHLGTVRDLVGSSGELIDHLDYDSFGSVSVETQPAYGDRFKFTGREFDAETGLYYYRARFFDPALGRFVSQDPIGFSAGDPNLYRYVHNSPLTATDPMGETAVVEYLAKIGRGPVGTFIANASFNCVMGELTMWSLGQLAAEAFFGKQQPTTHDGISLAIGITGCAVLGISAHAQVAFLIIAESIHMAFQLRDGSANGLDVALMLVSHAGGLSGSIRGGSGLSEHAASIKTSIKNFLADESGSLRIPIVSRSADDLIDLVPPPRRHHILDGEVRPNGTHGGGHRGGTGFPGKSEFPTTWTDDEIMHHISDVATDSSSAVRPGHGGDIFVQGTRDGIDIEVLIRNGEIWTAYPTNVARNP